MHYVPVAFPPPTDERRSRLMDRWRKELVGEIAARRFGPCHLMKADADDCVSRRLAGFVARHPDADGWYIDRGYVYLEGGHHVRPRRSGFHRWCGTCNIVRSTHVGTFASLLADTLADTPASAEIARRHYVPHMDLADVMSARGTPLGRLPFPGAVYVVGHGDNSGAIEAEQVFLSRRPLVRAVRRLVSLRAITRDIREEFGLYDLDGPPGPGGH